MSVRRLEAETLRDTVLAVSGKLNEKMFGTPVPVTPDETGQTVIGIDTREGAGRFLRPIGSVGDEAYRRSIYIQSRRSLPLGMLETFDAPEMTPNCECRASSTVTPQSLLLMNNLFVIEQSQEFAKRLKRDAGDDVAAQLRLGWRAAYGRPVTESQLAAALSFVRKQAAVFAAAAPKSPPPATAGAAAKPDPAAADPQLQAVASFCQSLLCSNGFLYVD
jgi:hypothetical protein